MQKLLILILTISLSYAQEKQLKFKIYDVSCGQCQFGLKKPGCELAIKVDDKAYFVSGTDIDAHGDAHAKDGFCNTIKKAEVIGELKNGIFEVTYFKLLPILIAKKEDEK
jgi:hypothetical protein